MIVRKEDGAGGKYMVDFLKKHIISKFNSRVAEISLEDMEDSTDFHSDYVLTTDSYVVDPVVFPGGSIGSLAICGTCNDLSVLGAEPSFLSLSLIIQDGFSVETLEKIVEDMEYWLKETNAKIITGDTKVVEANIGILVNTSGVGLRNGSLDKNLSVVKEYRDYPYQWIRDSGLAPGDAIIISGGIAEHGAAIMSSREGLEFELDVKSDAYPVWLFLNKALEVGGITSMKDPTRGGVAGTLNEMAEKSGTGVLIGEERVPIREDVKGFCDVLGLDPMAMANEGKVVMGICPEMAEEILDKLKKVGQKDAEIVGYATDEFKEVVVETMVGTKKILPSPAADPIPRVC
ncbi:MAG: hydrogenase expression/formation protein HypE [Archaeoglobaceae archaeon]